MRDMTPNQSISYTDYERSSHGSAKNAKFRVTAGAGARKSPLHISFIDEPGSSHRKTDRCTMRAFRSDRPSRTSHQTARAHVACAGAIRAQKCRSQMMQYLWPAGSLWPLGQTFSPSVAGRGDIGCTGRGAGRGGGADRGAVAGASDASMGGGAVRWPDCAAPPHGRDSMARGG